MEGGCEEATLTLDCGHGQFGNGRKRILQRKDPCCDKNIGSSNFFKLFDENLLVFNHRPNNQYDGESYNLASNSMLMLDKNDHKESLLSNNFEQLNFYLLSYL